MYDFRLCSSNILNSLSSDFWNIFKLLSPFPCYPLCGKVPRPPVRDRPVTTSSSLDKLFQNSALPNLVVMHVSVYSFNDCWWMNWWERISPSACFKFDLWCVGYSCFMVNGVISDNYAERNHGYMTYPNYVVDASILYVLPLFFSIVYMTFWCCSDKNKWNLWSNH